MLLAGRSDSIVKKLVISTKLAIIVFGFFFFVGVAEIIASAK